MNTQFAVVTTNISPGANFITPELHGTFTDEDAAFRCFHNVVDREIGHWPKAFDVHARRCVFSDPSGRKLVLELLSCPAK